MVLDFLLLNINGMKKINLCERLVNNYGPDMVGGVEHSELDVKKGEIKEIAEFVLR